MNRNAEGIAAERVAAIFLQSRGLRLLETNYRCRFGEIDLILRDGETLVFAEVRLRKSGDFGGAAASITAQKRTKLLKAARHYLAAGKKTPRCRFDAVLLSSMDERDIQWIKNAFGE
ncbi:MAG TPA: YraN family protein [Burkholderiales bacterium]|jgi:putative endonuclease|nr:YraN family protein [Burkholderiales bacterium]